MLKKELRLRIENTKEQREENLNEIQLKRLLMEFFLVLIMQSSILSTLNIREPE